MVAVDETWGLWVQFIFCDAMAYIGLYIGVRTGDWDLRTASLKLMAPLFTAFDHPTYQKLISNHIADILDMPPSLLLMLKQGGFVVSISGREGHSVAIDEAHEMFINKNIKEAVVKPSEDYIKRVSNYLTYRTKTLRAIQQQLFPESSKTAHKERSVFSTNGLDVKFERMFSPKWQH